MRHRRSGRKAPDVRPQPVTFANQTVGLQRQAALPAFLAPTPMRGPSDIGHGLLGFDRRHREHGASTGSHGRCQCLSAG